MKLLKPVFALIHILLLNSLFSYSQPADNSPGNEKRLALVIGNGKYINSMELANPVNDARAMKAILISVGFDVYEYEDLNQAQIKKAIDEFGQRLKEYSVGLFYYAGHGIQSKGSNYLIPVDAMLQSEQQVEYDCVQADRVLGQMEAAGSKINIVILDACRNNPFERSWSRSTNGTGLAFMNAPSGSLIAYATSPGRTASDGSGSNGLYTSALLENIKLPGINILQMFQNVRRTVSSKSVKQQIPWESTSLTADFFFVNNTATGIVQSDFVINKNIISYTPTAINNATTWKKDEKSFWLYHNGEEISLRSTGSWSGNSWLVYDPSTNITFLLEDYVNKAANQLFPAKILGNSSDAWWRFDANYYYLYVRGTYIATRTKRFTIDNDLLVYDEPTNITYIFRNFTGSADNQFRPAVIFDNAEYAFWRRVQNSYWLYVKGEEIQSRTKNASANNDLLIYDEMTNITYLLEGYYTESATNQLKPARVISYMDDILWMRTGNSYWLYLKGELISGRTTNYQSGNNLIVTDTQTKITYSLYDYFNTPDNQFRTAYLNQLY